MKPYQLERTWIDLDHVLAVRYEQFGSDDKHLLVHLTMMFRSDPLSVDWVSPEDYAKLLAAWKGDTLAEARAVPIQGFGIIDPDYARVFTQARILAWQYGYACLAHGSFTRDLDLLLVPWTDAAQADDVDYFAPRIAEAAGLEVSPHPPSAKLHGRKAWTLLFPGFSDARWVDLSVLTPLAATQPARVVMSNEQIDEIFDAHQDAPTTTFRYYVARELVAEYERLSGITPSQGKGEQG